MQEKNKYRYEIPLSSLRRDRTRVGIKMPLLPSVDFELGSLDGHRRTRNKLHRFGFQGLFITYQSNESMAILLMKYMLHLTYRHWQRKV